MVNDPDRVPCHNQSAIGPGLLLLFVLLFAVAVLIGVPCVDVVLLLLLLTVRVQE